MRIDNVEKLRIRIKQLEHKNRELSRKAAKYDKAKKAIEFLIGVSFHAYMQAGWSKDALNKLMPKWIRECLKT